METAPLPTTLAEVEARQAVVDADLIARASGCARTARSSAEMRMIAAALRPRAAPVAAAATAPPVALPDDAAARRGPQATPPRAPPPAAVEAAAPPPSPPPDDDASDVVRLAARGAPLGKRYYDAETRAHYWYDARTQVVSWSDPERPPRDPAHARRPTAASLARSLPGSPAPARFPLLRRRVGRLRTGGGAESRNGGAGRAGLPQGAAHAAARRLREGQLPPR